MDEFASADNWVGFVGLITLVAAAAVIVAHSRWDPRLRRLLCWGLWLRVAGAIGYFALVTAVYGSGDYRLYFNRGLEFAEATWAGDFAVYVPPDGWVSSRWWGTHFIVSVSGLLLTVIGPTMLGGFLVFSLLAFAGLLGFGAAAYRSHPAGVAGNYLRWVVLFPSLWFWPSAMGKEAVILLGIGLCVLGYVGRNSRIGWMPLLLGVLVVSAVRPQVTMVLLVSMVIAQWVSRVQQWTFATTIQGVVILGLSLAGLSMTAEQLGIEPFDVWEVTGYMESRAAHAAVGGSAIAGSGVGWSSVPSAFFTTLFRPLPWEAQTITGFLSCLEMVIFWSIVYVRRRDMARGLRHWRADALTRLALPFIFLYSASLGMVLINLGIIARQRIFIFPFLFALLEGVPATAPAARRTPRLVLWGQVPLPAPPGFATGLTRRRP